MHPRAHNVLFVCSLLLLQRLSTHNYGMTIFITMHACTTCIHACGHAAAVTHAFCTEAVVTISTIKASAASLVLLITWRCIHLPTKPNIYTKTQLEQPYSST